MLGKTFTKQGLARALRAWTRPSSSRCSPRSCARRCSPCRPIPARPNGASTPSCRTSSSASPTRRFRSKERKAKHLAAAEFLLALPGSDEDEIVEVVAAHYIDALEAAPDAPDAGRDPGQGAIECSSAQASAPRRWQQRRGAAGVRASRRADRRRRCAGRSCTSAPARWPASAARADEAAASASSARSSSSMERTRRTRPPGSLPASPRAMWDRGRLEDGLERMDLSSSCSPGGARRRPRLSRSATRQVPLLRRARPSSACNGSRPRWRWPRALRCPRCLRRRSRRRASC